MRTANKRPPVTTNHTPASQTFPTSHHNGGSTHTATNNLLSHHHQHHHILVILYCHHRAKTGAQEQEAGRPKGTGPAPSHYQHHHYHQRHHPLILCPIRRESFLCDANEDRNGQQLEKSQDICGLNYHCGIPCGLECAAHTNFNISFNPHPNPYIRYALDLDFITIPSVHTPCRPPPAPSSRTVNKMAMSNVVTAPAPPPPVTMTTKEWVVPPRPKPGRKPATDTPPTKRKAQNRAAQRAFRERRAARVGELEEQIEEQRENREKVEGDMRDRIQSLEMEAQTLRSRCLVLESTLERERGDRAIVEAELESLRRKWNNDAHDAPPPPPTAATSRLSGLDSSSRSYGSMSTVDGLTPRQPRLSAPETTSSTVSIAGSTRADPPRSSTQPFSISQIISPPDPADTAVGCGGCRPTGPCACVDEAFRGPTGFEAGCGKCTLGSRCECLEENMAAVEAAAGLQAPPSTFTDLKRTHPPPSPAVVPEEKRARTTGAMETDFTSMYSSTKHRSQQPPPPHPSAPTRSHAVTSSNFLPSITQTIPPRDSCGFCDEGTYCPCAAEAAAASAVAATAIEPASIAAPVPISVSAAGGPQTPPPSENDAVPPMEVTSTGAIKLPRLSSLNHPRRAAVPHGSGSRNPAQSHAGPVRSRPQQLPKAGAESGGSGCGSGGPGTCAQCLSDPKSGLFCRSLAANFARQNPSSSSTAGQGGCCGGGTADGGCCKDNDADEEVPKMGLALSCADAYKTISSHRGFEAASDDIGMWLPQLRAQPTGQGRTAIRGREGLLPIEVEAASIMSVLKGFDVRFGKGG